MLQINNKNVNFSGVSSVTIEDRDVQIATISAEFNEPNLYFNFSINDFQNYKSHQEEIDKDFNDFKNTVIQTI